jgi:hypothetical protein
MVYLSFGDPVNQYGKIIANPVPACPSPITMRRSPSSRRAAGDHKNRALNPTPHKRKNKANPSSDYLLDHHAFVRRNQAAVFFRYWIETGEQMINLQDRVKKAFQPFAFVPVFVRNKLLYSEKAVSL